MKPLIAKPRMFLFLQGPPGPFFGRLGEALAAAGHGVLRVNFHGGDKASWPGSAVDYRGTGRGWPAFLDALLRERGVTDLVLFGDCRPLHRSAHGLAKLNNLRIHVFEEGYIRPDWITLELDGVNGHSSLPRDPDWYVDAAATLPPVPAYPPIASSFERRAREAMTYYSRSVLGAWRFPHYRSHRPEPAMLEAVGWLGRLARSRGGRRRAARVLAQVGAAPYFVFPLQLNSDHQIRIHSPFGNMRVAIDYVIASFARSAPPGTLLIIKQHPLDNGLVNWRRRIRQCARKAGVADRVLFLEEGDIAQIVAEARGVVTINSTTGTLSLGKGVPTIVMGQAVYDIPGITHQGPLDDFWRAPAAPEPLIWDAFCRVLRDRCLVRGGFLSDEGLDLLVAGSLARLTQPVLLDGASQQPSALVIGGLP